MKKRGVTKESLSVTIDKNILKRLNDFCEKNLINKSKFVESLIEKQLGGKK
ncbi:MAG: hypothetical protein OEL87_03155 [Nanoarchaeota archaeon]|nr:hypothetical protein [Nanoarchaeota archaeon]